MKTRKKVTTLTAGVRKALLAAGADVKTIDAAALLLKPKPSFKMSMGMRKRICELVADEGVAVVTQGKVYTLAGYKSKQSPKSWKHLRKSKQA